MSMFSDPTPRIPDSTVRPLARAIVGGVLVAGAIIILLGVGLLALLVFN